MHPTADTNEFINLNRSGRRVMPALGFFTWRKIHSPGRSPDKHHQEAEGMGAKMLVLVVVLAPFIGRASSPRYRCPGEPESVERDLKGSAAVFSGEVVRVRITGGLREAHLRVSRAWKGVDAEEVTVFEPANAAESPNYQDGVSYLVFAVTRDGKLFTGMCSRTKPEASAQRDLRQLGEGRKPKGGRG